MLRTLPLYLVLAGLFLWAVTAGTKIPLFTLAAITIHEAGHLLAACLLRLKPSGITADNIGIRLWFRDTSISYGKEIALCAAGPAANLLSLLLFLPLRGGEASFFFSISIALALLNLLPIEGFDGGRILHSTLSLFVAPMHADRVSDLFSFFFLFVLWCISIYLMMRTGNELSLFFFSASLFFRIFLQKRGA